MWHNAIMTTAVVYAQMELRPQHEAEDVLRNAAIRLNEEIPMFCKRNTGREPML